ncbi:Ulp1 protease family C terminal catalytic domain [Trypanosoma vivax]|nr:Ulp1 protease family C terminal catalytic domain [Trypanosoma vivax]
MFLGTVDWLWTTAFGAKRQAEPIQQQQQRQCAARTARVRWPARASTTEPASRTVKNCLKPIEVHFVDSATSSPTLRSPCSGSSATSSSFVKANNSGFSWRAATYAPTGTSAETRSSRSTPTTACAPKRTRRSKVGNKKANPAARLVRKRGMVQRIVEMLRLLGSQNKRKTEASATIENLLVSVKRDGARNVINDPTPVLQKEHSATEMSYSSSLYISSASPDVQSFGNSSSILSVSQSAVTVQGSDMRQRVMSASFSKWEEPLAIGVKAQQQTPLIRSPLQLHQPVEVTEALGVTQSMSPETKTSGRRRTRTPSDIGTPSSTRAFRSSVVSSPGGKKNILSYLESDASDLAVRIQEVEVLLQGTSGECCTAPLESQYEECCDDVMLLACNDKNKVSSERYSVLADPSRSLLQATDTDADRQVRAIYEEVMSMFCHDFVQKEIKNHLLMLKGAAHRALERFVTEVVLGEVKEAIRRLPSRRPLSVGVRRHVTLQKGALPNELMADVEDDKIYHSALQRGAHGTPQEQQGIAVSLKTGHSLTYRQLKTLGPNEWLNDQIINAYLGLICEERNASMKKDVAVTLGTHFFAKVQHELLGSSDKLAVSGPLPQLTSNSGILRWFKRKRHILQPGATRIVLVPINLMQSHWTLAVLNWDIGTWLYYDSFLNSDLAASHGLTVLQLLAHVFSEAKRLICQDSAEGNDKGCKDNDKKNSVAGGFNGRSGSEGMHAENMAVGVQAMPVSINDLALVVAEPPSRYLRPSSPAGGFSTAPQQENTYDCGVFVCQTAWCAAHGIAPEFNQGDMMAFRRIMLHELLLQRLLPRLPFATFTTW